MPGLLMAVINTPITVVAQILNINIIYIVKEVYYLRLCLHGWHGHGQRTALVVHVFTHEK